MKEYEYLKRLGKCISNGSVRGEILDEYKAHLSGGAYEKWHE